MKKGLIPGLTFLAALALAATPAFAAEKEAVSPEAGTDAAAVAPAEAAAPSDSPTFIFLTREEHEKANARQPLARRSANMTYHGGNILTKATVKSIFWGTTWN